MNESEKYWREQAERIPPSAVRTELYEQLRSMLALRDAGDELTVNDWLEQTESFFTSEYERCEGEAETVDDQQVMLAEQLLDEGVEDWLEAFQLTREGAPSEEVLEVAEQAQRLLLVVQQMGKTSTA